jgi:anti-sigma regulatory factor (Ser/Thr protein kinase)
VRIDAAPDRMIVGRAASDIVHLMAELIDNALSYSPPGSPVTIQAGEDDGKVEIEIIDNGLGMAGDALAQANDSLKRGGEVTIDTARRMGLFVVSRLAEEHGLKVKLRRNTNGGGIIASISLPTSVLVSDAPVEHVSVLDAPEPADEPVAPVAEELPEEEYDPYLERIEEAIAAVTGLPRRRPGQTPGPATQAPAAPVGMFDAAPSPELPPGFEPTELPSMEEAGTTSAETVDEPVVAEADADSGEESLAQVVAPDFGGEWVEAGAPAGVLADTDEPSEGAELRGEPVTSEHEAVDAEEAEEPAEAPEPAAEHDAGEVSEPSEDDDREPVSPWAGVGRAWGAVAAEANEPAEVNELAGVNEPVVANEPAEVYEPVVAASSEEPAYDVVEPVVARADDVSTEQPEDAELPMRLQIRRPLSAAPAATALEGEFVAQHDESEDSTIFGQLRSNWLSDEGDEEVQAWAPSEVDRGWNAADRAENADAEGTTRTGLPVRRPGGRLVPGGVSQEPATKVVRDPEAIRNRLAAHAAGVSRGRAAAAAEPDTFDYSHEETGPA